MGGWGKSAGKFTLAGTFDAVPHADGLAVVVVLALELAHFGVVVVLEMRHFDRSWKGDAN
jgi:hypothetical protein